MMEILDHKGQPLPKKDSSLTSVISIMAFQDKVCETYTQGPGAKV